jgi:hypothetical protein
MFCDDFPAFLYSMVEISWWNASQFSSLTAHKFEFGGKKSKWECEKWLFNDISHAIVWYAFNKFRVVLAYISKEI